MTFTTAMANTIFLLVGSIAVSFFIIPKIGLLLGLLWCYIMVVNLVYHAGEWFEESERWENRKSVDR